MSEERGALIIICGEDVFVAKHYRPKPGDEVTATFADGRRVSVPIEVIRWPDERAPCKPDSAGVTMASSTEGEAIMAKHIADEPLARTIPEIMRCEAYERGYAAAVADYDARNVALRAAVDHCRPCAPDPESVVKAAKLFAAYLTQRMPSMTSFEPDPVAEGDRE